ncbi:MAG: DMT family transporter [Clostridiales bacterium]|nr:DMT family transporter [Clostridiales bacterium]
MYMGILIALMAGVFISIQGSLNGMIGINSSVSAVISIPVAAQVLIYTSIVVINSNFRREVLEIFDYQYGIYLLIISALLGIGIMLTLTVSVIKAGPLVALSIVVFSQLLVSMVIEHFGFFGMAIKEISFSRITGLIFMLLGVFLFNKK